MRLLSPHIVVKSALNRILLSNVVLIALVHLLLHEENFSFNCCPDHAFGSRYTVHPDVVDKQCTEAEE